MKILILGSQGQLGRCLYDQFSQTDYDLIYHIRADTDIGFIQTDGKYRLGPQRGIALAQEMGRDKGCYIYIYIHGKGSAY